MSGDLDLFGRGHSGPARGVGGAGAAHEPPPRTGEPKGSEGPAAPLAARMRPRSLDEFKGQEHLLGPGRALRSMLAGGTPSSMIFWGPPGSGKTTLARLIADAAGATFVSFSAVTGGVGRVREIVAQARERLQATGRRTVLFCDEIHRFNKAQQDAFLPHVEAGTIVLIGATTENPSFEVVRPLLSRAPVMVLERLTAEHIRAILASAVGDRERGVGAMGLTLPDEVAARIAENSDGDARRALGVLETAVGLVGEDGVVTLEVAREAALSRSAVYDKEGEEHFNLISALHKAIRGSDADGALYWLARMYDAGEDGLYIARRLVRMASEDVGLADPAALGVAIAARDAFHFLGPPEGALALAEAAVYLAAAPKSNRGYLAWGRALEAARATPGEPVPLHLRNAPTELLKDLGYGREYRYDPDEDGGVAAQTYLPEGLAKEHFYRPSEAGMEADLAERLREFGRRRTQARARQPGDPPPEE